MTASAHPTSLIPLLANAPPLPIAGEFIVACVGAVFGWLLVSRAEFFRCAPFLLAMAAVACTLGVWVKDGRGITSFMVAWLSVSFTLLLLKPTSSTPADAGDSVEETDAPAV